MLTERQRLAQDLSSYGYAQTTYEALDVNFDNKVAADLCASVTVSEGSHSALEVVEHITKQAMTIVQEPRCMELGRALVKPVVRALLSDLAESEWEQSWTLFGLNRYEPGGTFGPHRDDVSASVLVITASGSREFDVYKTKPDSRQHDLTEVETTLTLSTGTIMILDGEKDPGHAVAKTTEASIVAVADVPYILRMVNNQPTSVPFSPPPRNY